jgi:hypothetical protein
MKWTIKTSPSEVRTKRPEVYGLTKKQEAENREWLKGLGYSGINTKIFRGVKLDG